MIDVHSHFLPPRFLERVRTEISALAPPLASMLASIREPSEPLTSLPIRLDEMDRAGIEVSVLSLPPPGVTVSGPERRAESARVANEEFLLAASEYPGRFAVLVALPLPDVDASIEELDRVSDHDLARGINLQTTTAEGWGLDDPLLEPVYRRAEELALPVFAHPAIEMLPPGWGDFMLGATLAPMVSSSLGAARLILSGMLDRVPQLDLIVPHLGGVLPYLTQRFDDFGPAQAEHDLSWYLRHRLYVDTCSYHPPAFRCALETCGADRLMLGTDYPIRGPLQRAVDDVRSGAEDDEQARAILGTNAARWFGLESVLAPRRS